MSDAGPAAVAPQAVVPPSPPPEAPAEAGAGPEAVVEDARAKAREILFAKGEEPEPEKSEVKPEPPKKPEEPPPETEISKRYAKVHAQEKRLSERQKAFLAEQETFKSRAQQLEQREALAKSDPVAFLEQTGWTKDQIIDWIRSDGKIEPEKLIKDLDSKYQQEIQRMREEREAEKAALEQERRQRDVQKVEQMLVDEVTHHLGSGRFPILASITQGDAEERGSLDQRVKEITLQVFQKTKKAVEPHEVLEYLEGRWAKTVSRLPGQAPAVKSASPVAVEPKPITNEATASRTVRPVDYDELDPEQRQARVQAILRGEIEPD